MKRSLMRDLSWNSILDVLAVGLWIYPGLVLLLRVSGKRTLSKMNAFDFVVTIALGSTLASTLVATGSARWKGVTALVFLVAAQFIVSWISVRWPRFKRVIQADPRLVFYQGHYLDSAMQKERVSREELLAAIRAEGIADPAEVSAIVLETAGDLTVLRNAGASLAGVRQG